MKNEELKTIAESLIDTTEKAGKKTSRANSSWGLHPHIYYPRGVIPPKRSKSTIKQIIPKPPTATKPVNRYLLG